MQAVANTEASILSRVMGAESSALTEAAAREVLTWGFSTEDQRRMAELAARAREGSLQPDEAQEAEAYERVSSILGLLKSKARRSLKTSGA